MKQSPRDLIFFACAVVASLLALFLALSRLQIDGDVTHILKGETSAYEEFVDYVEGFTEKTSETTLAVKADDLGTTLPAFEELLFELQFAPTVEGVLSLYSLRDPDDDSQALLTAPALAALAGSERLDEVRRLQPLAAQILSEDRTLTLVSVYQDASVPISERRAAVDAVVASALVDVTAVDIGRINSAIGQALVADQIKLALMGMAVSIILAIWLLGSVRGAVICAVPPILGLMWNFGLLALTGVPLDPLIAVVPVLLLVLAFADAIHLFYAIAAAREGRGLADATRQGLRETWPAAVLTSVTTAAAFGAIIAVGSDTLTRMALIGAAGLGVQLAAVLALTPLLCRLMSPPPPRERLFRGVTRAALKVFPHRRAVILAAFALLAGLAMLQSRSEASFYFTESLPKGSEIRTVIEEIAEKLDGSGRLLVRVEAADPDQGVQPLDAERLSKASQAIYGAPFRFDLEAGFEANAAVAERYLHPKGDGFALPVPVDLGATSQEIVAKAADLEAKLDAAGLGAVTSITGFPLVPAIEMPALVEDLRMSFYIAVLVVTALILVVTRSPLLALVALPPNLIPILGVEAVLVVIGQPLTLTGAIALTVAFGIAVDDSIHMLNRLRIARANGAGQRSVARALRHSAAPVTATSVIVACGFAVTATSSLPSTANFGIMVACAVVLAFFADLFILPALLAFVARFRS